VKFVFLTEPEIEGVAIRWDCAASKSPELVAAAIAAGFTEHEARRSPLGRLEEDFRLDQACVIRRGARALLGTNGSTLVEILEG
jgi:hypothetical protein